MVKEIKLKTVKLDGESPYIISINGDNKLIGDEARAYSEYLFSKAFRGATLIVKGHHHSYEKVFIIENVIDMPRELITGSLVDIKV